jgi:hypothetical protein
MTGEQYIGLDVHQGNHDDSGFVRELRPPIRIRVARRFNAPLGHYRLTEGLEGRDLPD